MLRYLVAASCIALLAQDQIPRPSFRSTIGLVQLDVSVLDGKRQPIRGLQASDFTVLEDGKPRPIRIFEAINLPPSAPTLDAEAAADSPSRVATNQVGNQDGRIVFILMDRTIPFGQPVLAARKIATAAVNALGPSDLAAVVTTGGNVPQTLTSDRARLLRAVNQGDWSTAPTPEQEEIVGKYDPFSDGRCLCGLCALETVTNLAEAARDAPRRQKLLLFIGSSIIVQAAPRAPSADVGCEHRVRDAREKMVDALKLSHLTVHSIDPSGLATTMYRGSGNGKQGQDGPVMRRQKLMDDTIQRLRDQGSLDVLPSLTGGRTFTNSNAPEQAVPDIFQESAAYYLLAFEPATPSQTRRYAIEVKVARSGAHVTTTRAALPQPGLHPAKPAHNADSTRSPLDFALAGLLPDARVPLEMSVAAFAAADGAKSYVSLSLDASAVGGGIQSPVDVAVLVHDQRGRRVATVREGGVPLRPGSNLQTHVMLPPGDYELRAAVQARDTGVAASVFMQLRVPSFADSALSMSDLVLGMRENPEPPRVAAAPDIPIVASTERTFRRGTVAWGFAQVYEGTQKTDALQAIEIQTAVMEASSGRAVRRESITLGTDAFVGRHAAVRVRLPLESLPAGQYVLRVDAARGSHSAGRAVAFKVE